MDRLSWKHLHKRGAPYSVWVWGVAAVGIVGFIVAMAQQSALGAITTGLILLIFAKHVGVVAALLGPARLLWRRISRNAAAAAPLSLEKEEWIVRDDLTGSDPQTALGNISRRLLARFRARMAAQQTLQSAITGENAPNIQRVDVNIPDMRMIEGLADLLRNWETTGGIRVGNPMATAGLIVTSMFGMATIEYLSGTKIMDEAVEGFTGVICADLASKGQWR